MVNKTNNKYKIRKIYKDFNFIDKISRGSREKYLVIDNKRNLAMFKYEKEGYICSESCSEKIAYEIAKILNYNCAKIEIAQDNKNQIGVLNYIFSDSYTSPHTDIVSFLNKDFDKRPYYTVSNIKKVLEKIDKSLFKEFIKIMVFDALIGEQDRHEENWGITEKNNHYYMSPLYDNGDSLLNDFKNENFALKFYENEKNFDAYIMRSKTYIYKEDNKTKYKHFELIKYLYDKYKNITEPELLNLYKLTDKKIKEIVNRIPNDLLTDKHKEYIILYLIKRRDILLNIIN